MPVAGGDSIAPSWTPTVLLQLLLRNRQQAVDNTRLAANPKDSDSAANTGRTSSPVRGRLAGRLLLKICRTLIPSTGKIDVVGRPNSHRPSGDDMEMY